MKGKDLDTILNNIKTGRAISTKYIYKATLDLMSTPIKDLVMIEPDEEEAFGQEEWVREFMRCIAVKDKNSFYVHALADIIEEQLCSSCTINSSAAFYLSSIPLFATDSIKPWLGLAAEDVFREAEIYDSFRDLFEKDMVCWEQLNGRAPSVGDILHSCFECFSVALEDRVIDLNDIQINKYIPERIVTPFSRTPEVLGFNSIEDGIDHEFRIRMTEMVCAWIIVLMILAPFMITLKISRIGLDKIETAAD